MRMISSRFAPSCSSRKAAVIHFDLSPPPRGLGLRPVASPPLACEAFGGGGTTFGGGGTTFEGGGAERNGGFGGGGICGFGGGGICGFGVGGVCGFGVGSVCGCGGGAFNAIVCATGGGCMVAAFIVAHLALRQGGWNPSSASFRFLPTGFKGAAFINASWMRSASSSVSSAPICAALAGVQALGASCGELAALEASRGTQGSSAAGTIAGPPCGSKGWTTNGCIAPRAGAAGNTTELQATRQLHSCIAAA